MNHSQNPPGSPSKSLPGAVLALLATTVTVIVLLCSPTGSDAATWQVKGGGFGHGVGMSQWGAYGMAKQGSSYKRILRHYYRGTQVTTMRKARRVRVLLRISPGAVRFSGVSRACGVDLTASRTYEARLRQGKVVLGRTDGRRLAGCGRALRSGTAGRVHFHGLGWYRGGIVIVPTKEPRGSLNVINAVPINAYVKGVVAKEVISSWPMDSLKAQAVAARSFALSSQLDGNGFELYADTRSQVYLGIAAETARTNRACAQTAGQVVTYKGRIAQTFFFDTSGGRTENVENVWFGEPVPYLKSVKDPRDEISPMHRWTRRFSPADMNARLGARVKGRLKKVAITRYGKSKRVIWARLHGTRGVSKIRGDTLQYALGLPDRLIFSIKRR